MSVSHHRATDRAVPDSEGESTPSSLLVRVRMAHPEAWQRLVHLYTPLVYHWCRRSGLDEAATADVGQDVFQAVAAAIGGFRHDREGDTFRGWLRVIARRKIIDFVQNLGPGGAATGGSDALRQLHNIPEPILPDDSEVEQVQERLIVLRRAINLVINDCEERTREAFFRLVVLEEDAAQLANELGMSRNSLYLTKARILRRLREECAELIDD